MIRFGGWWHDSAVNAVILTEGGGDVEFYVGFLGVFNDAFESRNKVLTDFGDFIFKDRRVVLDDGTVALRIRRVSKTEEFGDAIPSEEGG